MRHLHASAGGRTQAPRPSAASRSVAGVPVVSREPLGCPTTPCFSTPVPASADAAEVASAFARAHLCPEHGFYAEGSVLLLVSELVTHALLNGAPPIVATLECRVTHIRITVTDGMPHLGLSSDSVQHDLSKLLVKNVEGDWGLEAADHGESFWCDVPTGELRVRKGAVQEALN